MDNKIKTKVSLNRQTGLLEVTDTETGKLLAIQSSPDEELLISRRERLVERLLPDGSTVLVEADIDPSKLLKFNFLKYSSYVVDLICQKIVEGESLTKICKMPGFPSYATLCAWKKTHDGIQEQIDQARRDRAEFMRDQAYEIAMDTTNSNYDASKVQIDTMKWLASTDNKEQFGNAKGSVEVSQPLQIIVNTGIVREVKHADTPSVQVTSSNPGSTGNLPRLPASKD